MARILIVGGGCRGRRFAARMVEHGHAVRATTRTHAGRAAIEAVGAECWIGTPDRLATLRAALDSVTIACWMLARANGPPQQLAALHSSRLQFFLGQAIDTTVRGFLYDASASADAGSGSGADVAGAGAGAGEGADAGAVTGVAASADTSAGQVAPELLYEGERIVHSLGRLNAIPIAVLGAEIRDDAAWLAAARDAVDSLLGAR